MKKIRINLCGNPQVLADGREVSFPYKKAEGLLYYLCVRKSVTREELINLLWSEEDEAAGKKKLRDAIYQIRQALGKEFLVTTGHKGVAINPECDLTVDLDAVGNQGQEKPETFLSHFYIKNCYEFEEWADSVRGDLMDHVADTAQKLLKKAANDHDMAKMQEYNALLIKNDPYNENLYYDAMNMYAENGNYTMAIRLYHDLKKLLKRDMEMEPSRRVNDLFHRIFNMKEHVPAEGRAEENFFFGRNRELFEVSGLMDRSGNDRMNCIVVEGDEGTGKSAFLRCAMRLASGKQIVPIYAVCYRQGSEFFLTSWSDVLQELYQKSEEGLLADVTEEEQKIADLLAAGSGGSAEESGKLQYQLIERAFLTLFKNLTGENRILLVIDDVQWMDPLSFRLLVKLVQGVPAENFMLLASCENSSGTVMQQLEPLVRDDRLKFMELHSFTAQETDEFLHRMLPDLDDEPEKRRELYEMSDGNAFFLNEMVKIIREKGFTLERTPKMKFVIQSRLSGITEEQREVLGCMSVFPGKIGVAELELLMPGMDRLGLLRILEQLQQSGLIQEVLVGWNVYYKFVHRIYQEYIYEHQSAGKSRQYHQMLGEYYEKTSGDSYGSFPEIAYHFLKCHQEVRAYQYQIRYLQEFYTIINENFPVVRSEITDFGDDLGVLAEAEKMLGLAQNVIRLPDDSREVREMKMEMHYILGRHDIAAGEYDSGIANIESSIMYARKLNAHKNLLACCRQQIFHGIQTGDLDKVDEYVNMGLRACSAEDRADNGTFLRLQGWLRIRRGEYRMAEESLTKAIGVFRALQQEADGEDYMASIAACYNYMGDIYRAQERYDEALRNYNEGVRIGQGTAATNGLAQIYSNIGQVKYQQKRYAESYIYLDKARESLEKNGYRWGLERTEGYLALVCLATDKVSEARLHLEKAKTISEKIGNPVTQRVIAQAEEKLS